MRAFISFLALSLSLAAPLAAQDSPADPLAAVFDGLSQAVAARPNDPKPYLKRGMYYLWRKFDYEKALADLNKVLELDPKNAEAYVGRADVHTGPDGRFYDPKQAEADTKKALELNPKLADAYRMRGDLPGHPGFEDYEQAVADYQKAIELDPTNMLAYMGMAHSHASPSRKMHHPEKALVYAKKAIEVAPGESLAVQTLGDVLCATDNGSDEGLTYLGRAILLNPNNASAYISRAYELIDDAGKEREELAESLGNQEMSMVEIVRGNERAFRKALAGLGANSRLARALRDLDQAEKLCPHNDDTYMARAAAFASYPGMERAALRNYDKAVEVNPRSAFNLLSRAQFLTAHPHLALEPKEVQDLDAHDEDGLMKRMEKRFPDVAKKLVTDCDKAIELEPESDDAYFLRGTITANILGKYEDAIRDLTKAIQLAPNQPAYYNERASIHDAFGRTDQAEADREAASDLQTVD